MWEIVSYRIIDFDYSSGGFLPLFYYWFNVVEGVAWSVIGAYVFGRYLKNRKSVYEIVYSTLFLVFGLSDFREVADLPVWLLGLKGFVLAGLLWVRFILKKDYYPGLKI